MGDHIASIASYEIVEPLADGAFGELLLARTPAGEQVVVKRLKIEKVVDDKSLELFTREAGVLCSLHHPAVPSFIDAGVDDDGVPYLVQEHIVGPTLEEAIRDGRRFDTRAAERLARDLLDALGYLHGLHPPVIHRDVKPANIVLEGNRPVLVDFGAVAGHALLPDEASDTVVGTFGYMAPEMLKGHASPASDLYALGATLLYAFTGREPESFPTERLRLRFRDALNVPDHLADLLEALLEPAVEDRPRSAAEALAILDGRQPDEWPAHRRASDDLLAERDDIKRIRRRTIAGLPAKPVIVVGSIVVLGALVWLVPAVRVIALGVVIVVVLLFVLLITVGGV